MTDASPNVAIDANVATAARTIGSATKAPVPSPNRIFRSTIGSSQACERQSCAPVPWTGGPLPPLPGAGRQQVGDQRRGGHHDAVEQHGVRRTAA